MNYVVKTDVLKEPRGFIKIVQFFFSILAFACLVDWRGPLKVQVQCPKNATVLIEKVFGYPFAMDEEAIPVPVCALDPKEQDGKMDFEVNAVHSSQFFVFIGVVAFFASLGLTAVYVLYEDVYLSSPRFIWGDIILHGLLAFFWFVSTCAYAAYIWKIKKYSSFDWFLKEGLEECRTSTVNCVNQGSDPSFANLDIAALCGFVNVFLWGANIWFLFKETRNQQNQGDFPADVQESPTGYEPYGAPGMGGGSSPPAAGGQWGGPGQSSVQGGMNEI